MSFQGKRIEKDAPSTKQTSIAVSISEKLVFKTKFIRRDMDWHYIFIKRIINQEDIAIINTNAPDTRATKFIQVKLT